MEILSLPNGISLAWCPLSRESGHEAGRRLLAALYRERTGDAMPAIRVLDRGKPVFVDGPWRFSISHTRHFAFCALSPVSIGIDAEELDRPIRPALAQKILSPGELAQYEAARDKNTALLTFWVLKEADAKRSGLGLNGYPDHTNFSLDDPRVMQIGPCIAAIIQEEHHAL